MVNISGNQSTTSKNYEYRRKVNAMRHRKKRQRKLVVFYLFLILAILVVGIYFVVHNFFKVTKIEIYGSNKYTYEQIKKCSKIETNQNIFRYKSETIAKNLKRKLIYIDKVTVKKILPNKISITLVDAKPRYIVTTKDERFVVSRHLKILKKSDLKQSNITSDLIEITGLSIPNQSVGEFISRDDSKVDILIDLNQSLNNNKFQGVTKINLTNKSNIKIIYKDRITVLLGTFSQIDYKIKFAKHIIDNKLDKNEKGTIDLTSVLKSSKVYYSPYKEPILPIEDEQAESEVTPQSD